VGCHGQVFEGGSNGSLYGRRGRDTIYAFHLYDGSLCWGLRREGDYKKRAKRAKFTKEISKNVLRQKEVRL